MLFDIFLINEINICYLLIRNISEIFNIYFSQNKY